MAWATVGPYMPLLSLLAVCNLQGKSRFARRPLFWGVIFAKKCVVRWRHSGDSLTWSEPVFIHWWRYEHRGLYVSTLLVTPVMQWNAETVCEELLTCSGLWCCKKRACSVCRPEVVKVTKTAFSFYGTQWTAKGSVLGAVSLVFLFLYETSREPLNGFAPYSHGRRLVPCSDEFEGQRSGT